MRNFLRERERSDWRTRAEAWSDVISMVRGNRRALGASVEIMSGVPRRSGSGEQVGPRPRMRNGRDARCPSEGRFINGRDARCPSEVRFDLRVLVEVVGRVIVCDGIDGGEGGVADRVVGVRLVIAGDGRLRQFTAAVVGECVAVARDGTREGVHYIELVVLRRG